MKKLYLFRHGETVWNKDKEAKFSEEFRDIGLTEFGIEQARENAEILKNSGIEIIYSSPLKRAYQTAKVLADLIHVEIKIANDLQEFSIYDDSVFGLTRDEIRERLGSEKYDRFVESKDDFMDWRLSDCETRREARTRFYNALINICETEECNIIGIATHGAILREFLRMLNFEDDSRVKNCEIVEVKYNDKKLKIIKRIKNEN